MVLKGEISINTLLYVFLGIVVLAILVAIIVGWKGSISDMVSPLFEIKPPTQIG